jgi:putative oxidoreductase
MITTSELPAAAGKGSLSALWILSGLIALAFIGAGGTKLSGAAAMVELFDKVGLGQWFRYFTGLVEVAAGIGLLTSRYAFYAAVLLAVVTVGAFIAHVTVLGSSPAGPGRVVRLHRNHCLFTKALNINQERTRI